MVFSPEKLKTARDAGYSDDEIYGHLASGDARFDQAKKAGYSLDDVAGYFGDAETALQAAQFSKSLLGGVTSPLGAATALATGELQVETTAQNGEMSAQSPDATAVVQPVQSEALLTNTFEYPPTETFTAPEFPSTLTPPPPPKPQESGFLASAGAQAASGFIGATVGALEKALTPRTAFDNLQDARIRVDRLNTQLDAIRGKQSRGEALSAQEAAALDTIPKQIAKGQRVVRRFAQIAGSPTQEALRDIGEQARRSANAIRREDIPDIWTRYGAEPESQNITAQVGRGIGDFLLMVPAMSTGNVGTAAIVLQGAARAYNDAKTAGASEAKANTAALKTAPGLLLYMVGGRLAAGAVSKLMSDTASPMAKALAGFAGAEVANIGAGSVIRAMEGQDWLPNAETLTMDTLFALFHGFGEYGKASAESRKRAYFELQNRGLTPDQIKTREGLRYDVTPADVVTTSPTPLTDAATRETSTQPKQETPNASTITSPESVTQQEVRSPVGEGAPLRQQGQTAEARPEGQAEVTPPEQPHTERTVTPNAEEKVQGREGQVAPPIDVGAKRREIIARIDRENPDVDFDFVDRLQSHLDSGKPLSYGTRGDGTVLVGYDITTNAQAKVELTGEERRALTRAEADEKLADTPEERADAKARQQEVLRSAAQRLLQPSTVEPSVQPAGETGSAPVEQPPVTPRTAEAGTAGVPADVLRESDGTPIVAYRGGSKLFKDNPSEIGIHLGSMEQARVFETKAAQKVGWDNVEVIEANIRAKNPFVYTGPDKFGMTGYAETVLHLIEAQLAGKDPANMRTGDFWGKPKEGATDKEIYQFLKDRLKERGYDSIVYTNTQEGPVTGDRRAWIVFDKDQIVRKSPAVTPSVQPAGKTVSATVEQPPVTESTSPAAKAAERPAEQPGKTEQTKEVSQPPVAQPVEQTASGNAGEKSLRDLWSGLTRTPAVKQAIGNIEGYGWSFIADMTPESAKSEIAKIRDRWIAVKEHVKRVAEGKEEPTEGEVKSWRYWEGRQGKQMTANEWAQTYGIRDVEDALSKTDFTEKGVDFLIKKTAKNRKQAKETETDKPAVEQASQPPIPNRIEQMARSNRERADLPTELRQYSDSERADIARAIGATDTAPEALAEALIDKFAVNKVETKSPFPPGDLREKLPSEIDELIKSEDGPPPFTPEGLASEPSQRAGLIFGTGSVLSPVSLRRMVSNVVGWMRPRGHKPAEAYERLQIRDSERAAADRDIAYASRDLLKALRKQYGLSRLEMLGGGSRRIPVADVQLMTEYLKGNPTVGAAIPPEIRGILRTMRDDINGASQRVIDRLQWDLNHAPVGSAKAQRIQDLINTIQSNMDVYVHRAYKFFDAKDNAPDWYAKLPTSIRQNAENYLQSTSPTPLSPAEARAKLLNWLSDLKDAGSFGTAGKVGAKDPSMLMRRKVIPKELRAVLGEYNSPLAVYAKSMSKMSSWVANHKFLTDVKQMGMGRWLFEDDMAPPGFNTKISAEGSDSMSPLNGLRTSPEIAEAFTNLNAIRERSGITGAAAKLWFSAIAQSKFAATVQSTMTQARNLLSRPLMAAMAGHWNPAPLAKGVKALYADMIGSDKTWQQYTREAYKYGVLGDTAHGAELQAILKDAALQDVAPADLYSWSLMRAVKMVGWDAPAKVYRASDELGNLVGWENEMASQRKIHPTWTDDQIKAEAAKIVREIYPTYSETPELVQFFRKVPLTGPFVTFPYQIIRTMWNSTSRGLVELRSTNAEERKVGAKRLAGVTFALMAGTAAQELSKALLGIRSEEDDDFRLFQPPWARNGKFLFTDKDQKTGELSAINLSYIDPYSYMTDPVMAIISTARRNEPIDETISRSAKEFFRPWISEQMLPAAIVDAARNTTQMGGKVYNETDEAWQKAVAIGKHVGATLVPGTIQRVERRIIPAARDEQPEYGRKLELGREIARELSGIAFEKFNFKTGLAGKVRGFDEARENAEDVFRKAATQTQKTSPESVLEAYQDADARRFAAFREMRQVYLAALRRGVSIAEARRIMESRGMNAAASSMIARGIYRPMQVTDQVRRRAADVKRTLPMNEIQQIVQKERSLD